MNATAGTRIYNVCREATRELVMRIEAESDYDARATVSRLTGWGFDRLTTNIKPSAVVYAS
jgi:hypothetical protein